MIRLLFLCVFFAGCAIGPQYQPPSVVQTPQSIMTGKPCSDLPIDKAASMNPVGWTRATKEGVCGSKYASGIYTCADPAKCGEIVYTTVPSDPKDRGKTWHFVLDLLKGKATACAHPSAQFGVHLDCKRVPYDATIAPVRAVFDVVVPATNPGGVQDQTTIALSVWAAGPDVMVGQIGPVEQPTQ